MLNVKFTLSGGGGLGCDIRHMTECRCIHSQELLLLALLLVLLATGILNDLPVDKIDKLSLQQYRAWVIDSLGLEIVSYITVLCVQGILILSLLIFMPSLCSHSNFYIYLYNNYIHVYTCKYILAPLTCLSFHMHVIQRRPVPVINTPCFLECRDL